MLFRSRFGRAFAVQQVQEVAADGIFFAFDVDAFAVVRILIIGVDWKTAVCAADKAVIIMTQEYSSLRCNDTIDKSLLELGIRSRYAVINKVVPDRLRDSMFPSFSEISESTTAVIVGIVQEDDSLHIGMNSGVPAVCLKESYITKNFISISQ